MNHGFKSFTTAFPASKTVYGHFSPPNRIIWDRKGRGMWAKRWQMGLAWLGYVGCHGHVRLKGLFPCPVDSMTVFV